MDKIKRGLARLHKRLLETGRTITLGVEAIFALLAIAGVALVMSIANEYIFGVLSSLVITGYIFFKLAKKYFYE